jgi:hypothetical protein
MMSPNPDVEKRVSAWWEIPSKLLEGWQTTGQEGLSPPWSRGYAWRIEAVENLTHTGLRMQAAWCKMAVGGVRFGSGKATGFGQWTAQTERMIDYWSEASQQLTSTWFQTIKELRPFASMGPPSGGPQATMANVPGVQMMQDLVRNGLRMQRAWASLFVPAMAAEEPEARLQGAGRETLQRSATPQKSLETGQAA